MNYGAFNILRSMTRLGKVGAGVATSIAATAIVVQGANLQKVESDSDCLDEKLANRSYMQEFPPFRKWNYNWDGLQPGTGGQVWSTRTPEKPSESSKDDCSGNEDTYICSNCAQKSEDEETDGSTVFMPKARRNIILIRHGQYNQKGDGDKCQTLTSLGEEQAALVGKKLSSMGIRFNSIVSSSLTRAIQTANILLQNMEGQQCKLEVRDPLLSEGSPCVPEPPYSKPEIWNPLQRDILVEGARIEAGFRKYFHRADPSQTEDSWDIIVAHGNVIRYCACRALQFPPEGWLRLSLDHCSMTRFTILPTGEVVLRGFGDSGYIPYDKVTIS